MGLLAMVFKNIKETDHPTDYSFVAYVTHPSWQHKIKNLKDGQKYKGEFLEEDGQYAYSDHCEFLEELCEITKNDEVTAHLNKNSIDSFKGIPFFELIDFADDQGVLDHETCAILYEDFKNWKTAAEKHFDKIDNNYFKSKYNDWLDVFRLGKEKNCAVVF